MSELLASGLEKSYRKRKVVSSLSLSIASGEVVGLLGPNGAGKTTAFYMIVGPRALRRRPHRARRRGHHVAADARARAPRRSATCRRNRRSSARMTVVDNVKAILETRSDLDDAARDEALESLLEELHVAHLRDNMGMSLSGGERRRVEIARALAANPAFILLDEPFAGVDPLSVHDIQRIARHLADRGIGVLITDHNVRETLGNLRPGVHRQPGHGARLRIRRRDPCKSRGAQGLLGAGFQALTVRNEGDAPLQRRGQF